MSNKKVWFVTGAGRGMGVEIAKAALDAGYNVVATGRNPEKVAKAIGETGNLLVAKLDVTNPADAEAAVNAAVDRFGTIDVLVNNAANFYGGFFEELTPEQIGHQLSTNLIGPMNVTRAVLPVMRKQRSGHIISISSTAGFVGYEYCSAYAASKFGLEGGWSHCVSKSNRSASRRPSSIRAFSALSFCGRNRRLGQRCASRTTPNAMPSCGLGGSR